VKTEYKAEAQLTAEIANSTAAQECPTPQVGDNICRPLVTKTCKNCEKDLYIHLFYFNKTKNTFFSECKECNKKRSAKWNKTNKEQYRANCKKHKIENPELYAEYKKKEYKKNIMRYNNYGKSYRKSSHGKATRESLGRERELRKRNATPKWLSKNHREEMKRIYLNRPEGYHVDHIVPLKGKNVSGLHVPWNLQYLPIADNIRKRNKF